MGLIQALHPVLSYAPVYKMTMAMLGGDSVRKAHVNDYIRPIPGNKIIDLGCGPGDMLSHFPPVDYTGIDIEPKYIEDAKQRFGLRGNFICRDISEIPLNEYSDVDIVVTTGVLHHLNDSEAQHLLKLAKSFLKSEGRLITYDGCFLETGQHPFDLWMLKNDRGKYVRKKDEYIALAQQVFPSVKAHVRSDLLRVPYTVIMLECTN